MISKVTKIKAFQSALGSLPDGKPGPATWDAAYKYLESEGLIDIPFPYESYQFGCYVITGKPEDLILKNTKGRHSVSEFPYSMSGSFTTVEPSGMRVPISILVNDGVIIRNDACHAAFWANNKPETVLYYTYDGKYGKYLVHNAKELMAKIPNVKWAIGGGSLDTFNNIAEGFTGVYSDVFRKTKHNAIGFDKYGNIIGVFVKSDTLYGFRNRCNSIGLVLSIFVDGGHISAMNAGDLKYNTKLKQGYIVDFKGAK